MRRAVLSLLLLPLAAFPHLPARETKDKPKEDPAATKLLADARAARASWHNFPGFSADLEVNDAGKLTKGHVEVDAKGKIALSGIDDESLARATRLQLKSVVDHRLDGGAGAKTPCAFPDNNADHPLGRAIRVLNDEFHSSYRIRDRQVIVVNRTIPGARFTITVIENRLNEEKLYLPACYVVNYWDLKNDSLKFSQAFHQDWTRVDKFDLPTSVLKVTATPDGKLTARRLKLSNHKLK